MAEHGILMRDEMVRALLRPVGDPIRKTVTRRTSDVWAKRKVGDLLWVRECYRLSGGWDGFKPKEVGRLRGPDDPVWFRADDRMRGLINEGGGPSKKWRPGLLMPRWASRTTLRIVDLRRECGTPYTSIDGLMPFSLWRSDDPTDDPPHPYTPLPWVDDAEARREGVQDRAAYLALWERINGPAYPAWVWRIEFKEVARG